MPGASVPAGPHDITPDWLQDALAPRYPGVRVGAVEVVEVRQVTNTHAFLQVEYGQAHGAPTRMFCKMLPLDPERRTVLAASQMGPKEVLFYERLAPQLALRVPDVYVARHDPSDDSFVLLMEDLGASGCRVSDGTWGITPDSAARALDDLAALHVRFEDPQRRLAEVPWARLAEDVPPYGMVPLRYGLDHHRDRLSDTFAKFAEIYVADPAELVHLWANGPGPATVVHGDTHIGNLFDDRGRTGFLDWGVINVTTPLRDASYFLTMALQVEDRRAHERDLLRHYLEARQALGGEAIGWDEAWQAHRLHALYCVVAACSIVKFPADAPPARQVFANAFLARAEAAISDLESLGALAAARAA
jgi:Phosphotransferase enzyme family